MPVKFRFAIPAALLVVLMVAPAAYAVDPVLDPPPEPTTVTIPTLLPGLIVVVSTDTNGYLTSVDLHTVDDPTGVAPDYIATKVDNRRVRFENSDTGTRVEVKAKENKLETKVRSSTLTDLVGTHTWSGPVLGEIANVTFTVGDDGGVPTLSGVAVDPAGATISDPSTEVESDEIETKVKIRFTNDVGQRADLKIEIEVHTDDDDDDGHRASLKISLKTKDEKMRVPSGDLATLPTSWTGVLCDGTAVSANWTNNPDGSISDVVVTPESARIELSDHEFKVRFEDDAKLKVSLKLKDDGTVEMKVDPKIKCENGPDPIVNTPVDEKPHKDKKPHDDD